MVEEIVGGIYRIGVTLPESPLKELNSYFIRGEDSDLLIDTGFRRPECQTALEAGLAELGSDPARRDVLCTHLHSDHMGMADLFVGPGRKVYVSGVDLQTTKNIRDRIPPLMEDVYVSEGFPAELVAENMRTNPARKQAVQNIDERFEGIGDGREFHVGTHCLRTVLVPGHTPGNTMFWLEAEGIMFSGDHVLFDITPNITRWGGMEDALGDYLDSLERAKGYPVKLALPGHRKTGDYHRRIDVLLSHHRARLAETLEIVRREPDRTAYEIAGKMTWKIRADSWDTFPLIQKWFAVGECMSHLDYLRLRGRICREMDGTLWRYRAV